MAHKYQMTTHSVPFSVLLLINFRIWKTNNVGSGSKQIYLQRQISLLICTSVNQRGTC